MTDDTAAPSKPWYGRWWVWVLAALGAIIITNALSGPDDGDVNASGTATTAAETTTSTEGTTTTTASAVVAADTENDAACAAYSLILGAIANDAAETSGVVEEVFGVLADSDDLMALYLDQATLDELISFLDETSDGFAAHQRSLPVAPETWAETDRYTRIALSQYETTYASLASAFRLFKAADFEGALDLMLLAPGEIEDATQQILRATDAIPPSGC